jgi:hypothetical protein
MLVQRWYKGKAAVGYLKISTRHQLLHVNGRRARITDLVARYFPPAAKRGFKTVTRCSTFRFAFTFSRPLDSKV